MTEKKWFTSERMDIWIAAFIALVSLTTAFAAWRTSVVGSSAADANRQGVIDSIKKGTSQNESWRRAYEEAGYATGFSIESAAADAMDASGDKTYRATAKNLRQYLLPSLQLLSEPLGTQEKYLTADGAFDLEKRFADLEAETPDIQALNPIDSFDLADRYSSEQRWLTIGTVLLAISLFWLGMAEILAGRARTVNLLIGLGVYLFGVVFLLIIEAVAILGRGGAL